MQKLPDFSQYGYKVIKELGRNREGGRITWLAKKISPEQFVAVKQFCFAQSDTSWSGYNAHEREVEILRGLKHPSIPRYIDSVETTEGFLLVQEYIEAHTLATTFSCTPHEIKNIAISLLEILKYLQNLIPEVLHRDIKPENILIDSAGKTYLIDFGFSRIGSETVAGSSVFKGTLGYIAPEQLFKPTKASDVYSLGATLIFLLTRKQPGIDKELFTEDEPYKISFRHLLPDLSSEFILWLEKMVAPSQKERFKCASSALDSLRPISLVPVPSVSKVKSSPVLTNASVSKPVLNATKSGSLGRNVSLGLIGFISAHSLHNLLKYRSLWTVSPRHIISLGGVAFGIVGAVIVIFVAKAIRE